MASGVLLRGQVRALGVSAGDSQQWSSKGFATTYDGDFIANDFYFWSPEMLQRNHTGQASAIEKISCIRKEMKGEPQMPHLGTVSKKVPQSRPRTRPLACQNAEGFLIHSIASS